MSGFQILVLFCSLLVSLLILEVGAENGFRFGLRFGALNTISSGEPNITITTVPAAPTQLLGRVQKEALIAFGVSSAFLIVALLDKMLTPKIELKGVGIRNLIEADGEEMLSLEQPLLKPQAPKNDHADLL